MKRLQIGKNPIRALLLALVGIVATAGMLVAAPAASAAVTAAPEITSTPSDPNSQERADFAFQKGPGETSTANPFRFYCRKFLTATPPEAATGWSACGVASDPESAAAGYEFHSVDNGQYTFQVAGRESTNISTQGPIASHTWTQDMEPISAAPEIVSTPSDPNTDSWNAEFQFTEGAGEAASMENLSFVCRRYPTDSPPAVGAGWSTCGSTVEPQPSSEIFSNLPNGSQTFEVASREGVFRPETQGPSASFEWTQNVPVPTVAPVLTETPEDPSDGIDTHFRYKTGEGEDLGLVTTFQCRIDESAWGNCLGFGGTLDDGYHDAQTGNGEHTFEVRSSNPGGGGPSSAFSWTQDVPATEPAVTIDQVAGTEWTGDTPAVPGYGGLGQRSAALTANRVQGITSAGDLNGDGLDDLAIGFNGATNRSISMVFGSANGKGKRSIASIDSPNEGYRINFTISGGLPGLRDYESVGDQNGDGVPDLLVITTTFGAAPLAYVIYGVADPGSLPLCSGSASTRCLNIATSAEPAADVGYRFRSRPSAAGITANVHSAGDFDGDGIEDLAIAGAVNADPNMTVVRGGIRTGTTLWPDLLASGDVLTLGGSTTPTRAGLGGYSVGDLNGDGKDDLFITTFDGGGGFVVFGFDWTPGQTFSLETLSPDQGFWMPQGALGISTTANIGDVNGDGRPDLGTSIKFAGGTTREIDASQQLTVAFAPELPTADPLLTGGDFTPGIDPGYLVNRGNNPAGMADLIFGIGDFNNDGTPDQLVNAPDTRDLDNVGFPAVGTAYVLFGQDPAPDEALSVGAGLTPSLGVAIVGSQSVAQGQEGLSLTMTELGDLDGDGMTDFAFGAPFNDSNGLTDNGSVYIVYGKSLMAIARTGDPLSVGNAEVTLKAPVQSNGRDTEVYFEYGTTEEYGETTDAQSFEGSSGGDAAVIGVDGLAKNTSYHYRAVATNELGLTRYGDDRTFTTTDTDDPITDPCQINPKAPGCSEYPHCEVKPADCQGGKSTKAMLSTLVVSPKNAKVKRGKKTTVTAIITNAGGEAASGVKVCVKAPKTVKVKKCQTVGSLGAGKTVVKSFKVTVKKSAKKGKKASLSFTASGSGLDSRKATAKVVVR